jgi:glycine hydroxymethyltransferase
LIELINRTLFPGGFGGPHFNKIAAIGQCFLEVLGQDQYPDNIPFEKYTENVLLTTKILENTLKNEGLEIISPTENHLTLIKLPDTSDSLKVQNELESIGIICNRNTFPEDTKGAWKPGGLRLGTAALTSRGLDNEKTTKLAKIIADSIFERKTNPELVKPVQEIVRELNWYY